MSYIMVKTGKKELYIEKEAMKAVVMKPKIYKVPDAAENIDGISWFEGRIVVYYKMDESQHADFGVILESDKSMLNGIAGESADEEEADKDMLISVMPGVWEKKSD